MTQGDTVASLQIHCKTLINKTQSTGELLTSAVVGRATGGSNADQHCGNGAVSTGIQGRADNELRGVGLVCNESPATAGRWSNPIDWPLQATHATMTPQGDLMTYGFGSETGSDFDYDLWSFSQGAAASAHNTFRSDQDVWSFCNASIVMPQNGRILMPGGTELDSDNAGIANVPIYDPVTDELTSAPDMGYRRWYPTTLTLPNGEILVAGGRDIAGVPVYTPEIYNPDTNEWRSLFGANMAGLEWSYPRIWVAEDGRVFGISGEYLYYLDTQGSGSIQKSLTYPSEFATLSEATALMYRPGKIMQLGGNVSDGKAAVLIDINGTTPEVRATSDMQMSRTAWPNAQVLADGTVLVTGGSRVVNDAVTAALNPELWDPDTEEWTVLSQFKWPRLYHSNSVLLKDATVMITGGGNPGPVINLNSEVFAPPYLFNENGSPATRPQITWAPQQAAYGQTIQLTTDAADIAKISMVKTAAVTHSFNMEQRYIELPFTSNTAGVLATEIPASPTIATPGYYMIFVVNEQGTPSEAAMIHLGYDPADTPEPPTNTPDPADNNNLLVNGGFESGKSGWLDCSDASLSAPSSNANAGEQALTQQSGACLYQEFPVTPGQTYTLSCDAYVQNLSYSSVSLNMLDQAYNEQVSLSEAVTSRQYNSYEVTLEATDNAAFSAVTLYSEGPAYFDSCVVRTDTGQPAPPPVEPPVTPVTNLLTNGDFDQNKTGWSDCSGAQLTEVIEDTTNGENALQISNAGCIYQEFPVVPGKQYKLQCSARSQGSDYSSITLQMADARYNQLEAEVNVIGPGQYQTYESTLTAPASSTSSAVTFYSEDTTLIDVCYVEEI